MLIKTIEEIKTIMPRLLAGLNNGALIPNFTRFEEKYLVPLVGRDQYAHIDGRYTGGGVMDEWETALHKKMQTVVVAYAFHDDLGILHATITDGGVRTAQTQSMPRVYGWEFDALREALHTAAMDSVDALLQYLVDNKAHYPLYTGSDPYKQLDGLILKTAGEFSRMVALTQPHRTFHLLQPLMVDVQEQYMVPALGLGLFNYFKDAAGTDEELIIRGQLKKAVAHLTIHKACRHFAVQLDGAHFTIVGSGVPQGAQGGKTGVGVETLIEKKSEAAEEDGKGWLSKARAAMISLSKKEGAPEAFLEKFNASPLVSYSAPGTRDRGNDRRKTFNFYS